MLDDVLDLLREQARIDRVQDVARARDAVVELEVPVVVPGERADAIRFLHSEFPQCVRYLRRAGKSVAVGVTMARIVGHHGHDLALRMLPGCVPHQ